MEGNHGCPQKQQMRGQLQPQVAIQRMRMMVGNPYYSSSSTDGKMNTLAPLPAPAPTPMPNWLPLQRGMGRRPSYRALALDKAVEEELQRHPDLVTQAIDLKKLRRRLSNRLSAQRSRIKKANMGSSNGKQLQNLQVAAPPYQNLGFYEQGMQNFASIHVPSIQGQLANFLSNTAPPETSPIVSSSVVQQQADEWVLPMPGLENYSSFEGMDFGQVFVGVEMASPSEFDTQYCALSSVPYFATP